MNDPLVDAEMIEAFQRDLEELAPCQDGTYKVNPFRYEKCEAPASPDGDIYVLGHDHNGKPVEARKMRCAAGHWYTEVLS